MVPPQGCTMCVGSGVMCRVKRGTLRSGEIVKNSAAQNSGASPVSGGD